MKRSSIILIIWVILILLGTVILVTNQAPEYDSYSIPSENARESISDTSLETYLENNEEYIIKLIEREKSQYYQTQNIVYTIEAGNNSRIDIEVKYDYVQITDKYGVRAKIPLIK